jgi:predicted hotdog family 3-hydroxylacyl-ACP dehydratase
MIAKHSLDLLLPHQGDMSLLENVIHWDTQVISCLANSHNKPNNPLRKNNQLASVNAIEYAAQAMAIHSTLISQQNNSQNQPRLGFLATASKVKLWVDRLDTIQDDLRVNANCLTASADGSLYAFEISAQNQMLASGQALVMLASEL